MNIWLIIVIDIVVAVISVSLAGGAIWSLINTITFNIPFTKHMVMKEIIQKSSVKQIVIVLLASRIFSMVTNLVIIFGLGYWARPSGLIIASCGLVFSLIFFRPNIGFDIVNVQRYVNRHSICMDKEKLNNYLIDEFNGIDIDTLLSLDISAVTILARNQTPKTFR